MAIANAAPSSYQYGAFANPQPGVGGFNLPVPALTLDQYAKNLNILNEFDKNSAGPLTDTVAGLLPQMDQLVAVSAPLLKELTVATLPKIREYTEALKKYNQQGGSFPQPPAELAQFGGGVRI